MIKIPQQNFGIIESINYGCAVIKGLNSAKMGELVKCQQTNSIGSVVGILPRRVSILFYTNVDELKPKMTITRTMQPLSRSITNIKDTFGFISNVI